jgi:multisubunit Na+/H+ antiporter MnhE subunit
MNAIVTPELIIIGLVVSVITYYLSYSYFNDESEGQTVNTTRPIITTVIVTAVVLYIYKNYSTPKRELLTESFFSNNNDKDIF